MRIGKFIVLERAKPLCQCSACATQSLNDIALAQWERSLTETLAKHSATTVPWTTWQEVFGLSKGTEIPTPATCLCGCGATPKSRDSLYVRGHSNRKQPKHKRNRETGRFT